MKVFLGNDYLIEGVNNVLGLRTRYMRLITSLPRSDLLVILWCVQRDTSIETLLKRKVGAPLIPHEVGHRFDSAGRTE